MVKKQVRRVWKLQKNPGESSRSSSLNSTFFCGPPHQRRSRRRPDPRSLSPANRVTVDSLMFSWGEDDESLHFWHLYLTLRPHPSHHRRHTLIPSRYHFTESYKSPPTLLRRPSDALYDARRASPTRHVADALYATTVSRRGRLDALSLSWADFQPTSFYHMSLPIALLRRVAHAQSARHCSLRRLESPPTFPAPSI